MSSVAVEANPAGKDRRREPSERRQHTFKLLAYATLAYTLLVIGWGAFVRATGSGAGCGNHWPMCQGEVVPRAPTLETVIEYSHRITGALAGLMVLALLVLAFMSFPKRHVARRASVYAFIFMITEGLVGGGLVIFEKVANDKSLARGWWMSAHLINTFVLLASLGITAWAASRKDAFSVSPRGRAALLLGTGLTAVLFTGVTGAIAALGDTLFPAASLAEGIAMDFSPEAHVFLQLRALHPFVAGGAAVHLLVVASTFARANSPPHIRRAAHVVALTVVAQIAVGVINLLLAAPIAIQLLHLLIADAVWLALVVLTANVAADDAPSSIKSSRRAPAGVPAAT